MAKAGAREPNGLAVMRAAISILVVWGALVAGVAAHEVRPAYLELRETSPDNYDALWKVPARGDNMRLALYVRLPADAQPVSEPRGQLASAAYIERWRFERKGGLGGQTIGIDGLSATPVDVLVRLTSLDGTTQTLRATPDAPQVTIAAIAANWSIAGTYTVLGIEHILLGIDHLLFVFALVLLVKGWGKLVGTITAFTVAHSLTLAAATLGVVLGFGPVSRRLPIPAPSSSWRAAPYAIGTMAMFWVIERTAGFGF